jgi:hypothetical protein
MSEEQLRNPQSRSSCANAFPSLAAPVDLRIPHGFLRSCVIYGVSIPEFQPKSPDRKP